MVKIVIGENITSFSSMMNLSIILDRPHSLKRDLSEEQRSDCLRYHSEKLVVASNLCD